MCNEDGVTLDSFHLTSKPDLSVCASASLIIGISQPKYCSVNEPKKSNLSLGTIPIINCLVPRHT